MSTITLGFWKSITDLKDMLPFLLKVCSQSSDINCKILGCKILDVIIDMETNVRVSKLTQIFK